MSKSRAKGDLKPFVYRSGLEDPQWYCLHNGELKFHSYHWEQTLYYAFSIATLYGDEIKRANREAL